MRTINANEKKKRGEIKRRTERLKEREKEWKKIICIGMTYLDFLSFPFYLSLFFELDEERDENERRFLFSFPFGLLSVSLLFILSLFFLSNLRNSPDALGLNFCKF